MAGQWIVILVVESAVRLDPILILIGLVFCMVLKTSDADSIEGPLTSVREIKQERII